VLIGLLRPAIHSSNQVEVLQAPDDAEWKCPACIGYSDNNQPDASDDDFEVCAAGRLVVLIGCWPRFGGDADQCRSSQAPLPRTKPAADKGKGKAPMRDAEASVAANQKAAPSDVRVL
jgi:hypothetical protein